MRTTPGAIALTRTAGANSTASCRVRWITAPAAVDLVRTHPLVAQVEPIDVKRPSDVAALAARLAKTRFESIVSLDDEEPLLLQAFANILASHPRAVMILAPRHPERFGQVAELLEKLGIRFWRRSLWGGDAIVGGVLLVDTIGELAALYRLADVAFVGGSLVPRGGHNIIEPAQHGVPIVVGNHTENFRDIVTLFQGREAVRVISPAEFPLVLMELISKPAERAELGRRAAETLRAQMGATQRTVQALEKLLAPAGDRVGNGEAVS